MKLFPKQPTVSKDDTARLLPHVSNRTVTRKWIKTNPMLDDLKRAVMIEVFRCISNGKSPLTTWQRGVYQDLLAAIMKRERYIIDEAVKDILLKKL